MRAMSCRTPVPDDNCVDGRERLEHLRRVRRLFTRAGDDRALRLVRALEERVIEELSAEANNDGERHGQVRRSEAT